MNMNDAFIGSLIFNKDSGGGDTPLEFTKTSILDKTQMTNIVLTEDYTNYPFLLFSLVDSSDNMPVEALVPTAMITETFKNGQMICLTRMGANHHVRYRQTSNTEFTRYDGSYVDLVDVFGVTVNKPFITDVIYSRGKGAESAVSISHDNILNNDIIFLSGCWNADADFTNNYVWNLGSSNGLITQYNAVLNRRANYNTPITITNTAMSSAIYYMVLGIKFT